MKFKKFLGAVCSFLLAATSFLCGGPASAQDSWGNNNYVFMVNSGEDLGNGECDGDERDKTCWGTITELSLDYKKRGYQSDIYNDNFYKYLMLNPECPIALKAMENMTVFDVPDVVVVVANLAKDRDEVIADINKHFDQISDAQKNGVLYSGSKFDTDQRHFNKEVYLNTVPVVIYGVVPEGMEQKTLNEEFIKIAEQIRLERQGDGAEDGKIKYIHNEVIVRQSDGTHTCINMNNKSERRCDDFYRDIDAIAKDKSRKPTLWENYHYKELPRRKAAKIEAERKAEAKRKKIIVDITLVGLGAALAIGSAIFDVVKHNRKKESKGNKTKVPKAQVQKSQVAANA